MLSRLVSGVRRPRNRVLGIEFAGDVAALGSSATAFSVGDPVFGSTGFRFGAFADYLVIRGSSLIAPKPPALTYVEAASLPDGGLNALWCLRFAGLAPGQRVLVYGASGAIGAARPAPRRTPVGMTTGWLCAHEAPRATASTAPMSVDAADGQAVAVNVSEAPTDNRPGQGARCAIRPPLPYPGQVGL